MERREAEGGPRTSGKAFYKVLPSCELASEIAILNDMELSSCRVRLWFYS